VNDVQLLVLIHLFNGWHSGGGSRGYRLLCLALRAWDRRSHPGQHGIHPLDIRLRSVEGALPLYRKLELAWAGKL
jgi:hypothetical protein